MAGTGGLDGDRPRVAQALLWAVGTAAGSAFLALEGTRLTTNMLVKLVVVVVALIVAVAALQRPHWALFALPAVAAFDRPVTVAGFSVQLTTLALAAFAPAFASRWRSATPNPPVALGAAALVIGAVVSCFFASEPSAAITGAITWALLVNVVLGGLGMIAERQVLVTYLGLEIAWLGAVVSVLGWLQGRGIYTVVGPPFAADRIDSSFGWYSNYGSFVAMATVVAIGAALTLAASRRSLLAILAGTAAVIGGFGTLLSLSRGAALCVGIGAGVLLCTRLRRPAALFAAAGTVAAVGVVAYLLTPAAVLTRFMARFSDVQGGDDLRRVLQDAGQTLLVRNPQGIGVGGFRTAAASGTEGVGTNLLHHAHQMYVQIGLDLGWLGLVGFLVLLCAGGTGVVRAWRTGAVSMRTAFAAALIGSAVQGLNDYFFAETGWTILFGMVLLGSLVTGPGTSAAFRSHASTRATAAAPSSAPAGPPEVARPHASPRGAGRLAAGGLARSGTGDLRG